MKTAVLGSNRSPACDDFLAQVLEPEQEMLSLEAHRHVDTCLRCQVELVRQRRLSREMALLRAPRTEAGTDLGEFVEIVLGEADHRHARSQRRAVYFGGLAAATAGAVALGRQLRR